MTADDYHENHKLNLQLKLRRAWRRDMKDSGNEVRLQQTSGPMLQSQGKVGKPS